MPKYNFALEDIESGGGFVAITPGKYRARLQDCVETESSKGNPMLVWTWELLEGDEKGEMVKSWTSLQDHALFGFKEHCTALGENEDSDEQDTEEYVGRTAVLTIGTRRGRNRNGDEQDFTDVKRIERDEDGGRGRRRSSSRDEDRSSSRSSNGRGGTATATKSKAAPARASRARRRDDDDEDEDDLPF